MSSPNNFLPEATDNGGTHLAPVMQELLQRFDKLTFQDDVQQLQTVKEEEDETSNEQLLKGNIAAKHEVALANVKAQQKDLVDFFEWINPSEGWTTISSGNLSTGIAATPSTTLSSDYCSSVYVSSIDGDYFGDTTSSIWEFDLCRSRSAPARLFMYDGQLEVSSQSEVQSLEALEISSCGESLQAEDDDAEYFDLLEVYNTIPSVRSVMKTKKSSPRVKSECNGLAVLNFISDSYFNEDSSRDSEWLYDPWTTSPTYMMDWNEGAMADLSYFTSGYVDAQSMISKRSGSTASSISMESKDALLKAIRGKFIPPFNVVQKQVRDLAFKANNMKDFLGLIPEHYLDSVFFDYKMLVSEKMMN